MTIATQSIPGGIAAGLTPFPGLPHPNIEIMVEASRLSPRDLRLWFTLSGQIDTVSFPEPASPSRQDGLWERTCFEAFVGGEGGSYHEFNLSSSRQWAAYTFDGYRKGMAEAGLEPPEVNLAGIAGQISVGADLTATALPSGPWRLGLSAVIEELDGTKSYWALAHPPEGPPDFHHPDCFALTLPPPGEA